MTVLNVSATALEVAQARLGETTKRVHWIQADMESNYLPLIHHCEPAAIAILTMGQIEVKQYVGGLVKSFERRSA